MFDEELDPRTKKPALKDLSVMSVEELRDYKEKLLAEVQRVEGTIIAKSDYFGEADKFFKS